MVVSQELKTAILSEFQKGGVTTGEIATKFNIDIDDVIRTWIDAQPPADPNPPGGGTSGIIRGWGVIPGAGCSNGE